MNEDLKYTFDNINEWLKFAEAKNAGLLALNVAFILGTLQADSIFTKDIKFFEGILIILFCISTCICIYSILPVLNNWFRFYKKLDQTKFNNKKHTLNALFFGDITQLSAEQFIELFEHKHQYQLTIPEKDFGNQITVNAEICWQKYKLFSISGWFTFSGFILIILLVIVKMLS